MEYRMGIKNRSWIQRERDAEKHFLEWVKRTNSEQLQTDLRNWEYYLNDSWGRRVARDCGYTSKLCVRMINMIKKQMKENQ